MFPAEIAGVIGSLVIVLLIVGVGLALVIRRGLQIKRLAEHGMPVTGTVVSLTRMGSSSSPQAKHWRLRYSFTLADGRRFENGIAPSQEELAIGEGNPIRLVYLPENPKVSATQRMVNLARQAVKR